MGLHENADVDLAVAKIDAWCLKEVARHVDREDRQEAARDRAECIRVLAVAAAQILLGVRETTRGIVDPASSAGRGWLGTASAAALR